MHYRQIVRLAIEQDFSTHIGRTPERAMADRLSSVVRLCPEDSAVQRMGHGTCALRERKLMRNNDTYLLLAIFCWGLLSFWGCRDCDREQTPAEPEHFTLKIGTIAADLVAFDRQGERLDTGVDIDQLLIEELRVAKSLSLVDDTTPNKRKLARLKLKARLEPDGFTGQLHALVFARITRTGSIPLQADIDAVKTGVADAGPSNETSVYREHIAKAVKEAVTALDEQAFLLGSGDESLVKALGHAEPDIRVAAARTLAERRSKAAVVPMCDLLRQEQNQVGQAIVGALAVIGDERAVPCLIQWAGADDQRLVLVIDPLASIGGQEARSFLEMIASGHDEPGVRAVAEEGLRRVKGTKTIRDQ